ncbi:hypothetical protein TorRG33x02_095320 [Trema orientale]|uniref:CLAVATA3/ESR (CLE)-related protein n=1 Tax=Trema orientale TaxID=63057 RepID=A0A2P5FAD9_TREOI|nr:hypothetical protein TorRG33x02_095320 [Trema orientale]
MRALVTTTSFAVFLVLLFTSSNLTQLAAYRSLVGSAEKDKGQVGPENSGEQRMTWMNHGSSRGPRKNLVNPTVQRPFQVRELPL